MIINELQSSTDHVASLKRRGFLKAGGALVVAFCLPLSGSCAEPAETFPKVPPEQLDSWLAIGQDGSVTTFTGRIDMGTGVQTVFAQAVAEELDVNVNESHKLLETRQSLERMIKELDGPLHIAQENLYARESRQGRLESELCEVNSLAYKF